MKPEDIYELKLGQEIYWNGEKLAVSMIAVYSGKDKTIRFSGRDKNYTFDDICANLSLTPPKVKKTITLYRHTYKENGSYQTGCWISGDYSILGCVVHTETKTIEVDE